MKHIVATMQQVRTWRKIKLLYLAPETLVQRPEILVMLDDSDVACLAIDEAHCIAQWGHDFRQELSTVRFLGSRTIQKRCLRRH